jgi:hypothetical protein
MVIHEEHLAGALSEGCLARAVEVGGNAREADAGALSGSRGRGSGLLGGRSSGSRSSS